MLIGAVLGLFATLLLAAQAPSILAQEPPKKQDPVADLEKQIAEMQKKLADMKAAHQPAKKVEQTALTLPEDWTKQFHWRSIGPANMSGRITAISVYDADPCVYWVATASGGLIKTENNGVTFTHQFDKESTVSIGDVCVAPSDKNIVWVGSGENNPRNSVSYGDGVYKSTDGGKTWKNMGLKDTYQIGKVVVHPKNPDIVYVGALGRCYGPNPERGVYKTTDGGKTWDKVFYLDDKTGVIDMQMDPSNPEALIVAMWERKRDEFDSFLNNSNTAEQDSYDPATKWGPNAGLYKTTDGGKTFNKLTKGLPTSHFGRIGLDYYKKNPKVIFAIIDCANIGKGTPPAEGVGNADFGAFGQPGEGGVRLAMVREDRAAAKAGLQVDDTITEFDGKKVTEMEDINNAVLDKKPNDKVKVKYKRGQETKEVEVTLLERTGRGPGGGGGGGGGGRGGAGGGQAGGGQTAQPAVPSVLFGIQGENATDEGAKVTSVIKDSPAEKAGLKKDDVIIAFDSRELLGYNQLVFRLRDKKVGDKVKVKFKRGNETKEVEVTLATRPANLANADVAPPTTGGGEAGGAGFGGPGGPTRSRPYGAYYGGQRENIQDRQGPNAFEYGGIYKSTDGGESWTRINSYNPRPMYFSLIRVDPNDESKLFIGGVSLYWSQDGGKTVRGNVGRQVHADHHAMWIDSRDGRHMMVGCDGGLYASYDRMQTVDHLNTMAMGQFYSVVTDTRQPYYVYGGLQDNGSWGGPSSVTRPGGATNEDWLSINGGDGFVCRVDQDDPDWVYAESQNGVMMRRNIKTGERGMIRPRLQPTPSAQPSAPAAQPSGAGEERPGRAGGFRFNWNTPFALSAKNQRIFYCVGQYVFRSTNRGDDLKIISPEITRTNRGSGTAFAESPRNPDILWAGTDDGYLWVTKDGGKEWTNVTQKVGLPGPRWVATIEASRFVDGRAYVCFDAHRSNDDKPYIYATEDFGQTWRPITDSLPSFGSTRCLREDIVNQDLLFCGTEFALFASIDRGLSWTKINNNLPTVAVHEVAIHPTAGEIVAATHGRSLWVLDIAALRQMKPDTVKAVAHLYQPQTVTRWRQEPGRGGTTRRYAGENAPFGAQIYYNLSKPAEKITLKITDAKGETLQEVSRASKDAGLHKVTWNLARTPQVPFAGAIGDLFAGGGGGGGGGGGRRQGGGGRGQGGGGRAQQAEGTAGGAAGTQTAAATGGAATTTGQAPPIASGAQAAAANQFGGGGGGGFGGGGFGGRGGFGGAVVPPGTYVVVLTIDGKEYKQTVQVVGDPAIPNATVISPEEEQEWEDMMRTERRKINQ
jgi:photosystem II stability/assembly factor-like uncharacterized protein